VTVYLVGAGPGDPGLLTLRGAELLSQADLVVHDRLAEPSLLELAGPGCECVDVGKRPGRAVDQEEINALLVAAGRAGRTVVRLKGGDPYVFGRGGEEVLALEAAGVEVEVVPGVTSAVAVPAAAGVPVTHRGLSTSFAVITGHGRRSVDDDTDWEALARVGGTIVVLMGVAERARFAERLVAGGLDAATPVVAVTWGTRPEQTTVRTTLAGLADVALSPPATIVIGAVAGLDLAPRRSGPLGGRAVVVTRARRQASALSRALRAAGARPVEVPVIRIDPPADGGAALARAAAGVAAGAYDWVVFTSANAVPRLCGLLPDARSWAGTGIVAIGPATASALAGYHLVADVVPERAVAEGLLEALPPPSGRRRRLLLARAATGRDVLPVGLRAAGWQVEVVEAYRTVAETPPAELLAEAASADAICFTSSSTVTHYLAAAGAVVPPLVACIGPATAATARAAGLEVAVEAGEHTVAGLVDALVARVSGPTRA